MKRQPPLDDRHVIAWHDLRGRPHHFLFDLLRTPLGSEQRNRRVQEMYRIVEALKGQGCEARHYDLQYWRERGRREHEAGERS